MRGFEQVIVSTGTSVRARVTEAAMANVLVYASGLKSFSWSVRAKTGMNEMIVLVTAVNIAPPASVGALFHYLLVGRLGLAASRR